MKVFGTVNQNMLLRKVFTTTFVAFPKAYTEACKARYLFDVPFALSRTVPQLLFYLTYTLSQSNTHLHQILVRISTTEFSTCLMIDFSSQSHGFLLLLSMYFIMVTTHQSLAFTQLTYSSLNLKTMKCNIKLHIIYIEDHYI